MVRTRRQRWWENMAENAYTARSQSHRPSSRIMALNLTFMQIELLIAVTVRTHAFNWFFSFSHQWAPHLSLFPGGWPMPGPASISKTFSLIRNWKMERKSAVTTFSLARIVGLCLYLIASQLGRPNRRIILKCDAITCSTPKSKGLTRTPATNKLRTREKNKYGSTTTNRRENLSLLCWLM